MSYRDLLQTSAPKRYPIDSLGIGIYFTIAIFALFIFTGLANGVTLATLHLQTLLAMFVMIIFPTVALVGRAISQGRDVYSNEKTPFKTAEGPTIVLIGIIVVFIAEFFTIRITPAYAIFNADLTGLIFGFLTPVKLFYLFMGFQEEIFFRFGIQAYTERTSNSPAVGILTSGIIFAAYHQFVYLYFSFVVLAAGLALAVIYYYFPNIPALSLIHGGFNLVIA